MGLLEDINKTLERIPGWKRILAAPDELDMLRKRVELLEAKLSAPTGDICPKCREQKFTLISNRPMLHFEWAGKSLDKWECSNCGYSVERESK